MYNRPLYNNIAYYVSEMALANPANIASPHAVYKHDCVASRRVHSKMPWRGAAPSLKLLGGDFPLAPCAAATAHNYAILQIKCYFLPVSEIGRYLFWLFSLTACVLCNTPRLFVSRGLLLGFGELLSCKKDCHCRFVVMCVHFTANCQKWSRSKSLPPRFFACCCFT